MSTTLNHTSYNENYWKTESSCLDKYILSNDSDYLEILKKVEDFFVASKETELMKALQGTALWEELWLATYKHASRIVNASWNHATRSSYLNYASVEDAISEITMHLLNPKRLAMLLNCQAASGKVNSRKDPHGRLSFTNTAATNKFKDMNEMTVRKQTPPLPASAQAVKTRYRAANPLINLEELSNPESTYYNESALTDSSVNILNNFVTNETCTFFMKNLYRTANTISFFLFICRHYFGFDTAKLVDILHSDKKAALLNGFSDYCASVLKCDCDLNTLTAFDWSGLNANKVYKRVNQIMDIVKTYTLRLNEIFDSVDLKDFFLYVETQFFGHNKRALIAAMNCDQKTAMFHEFSAYCAYAVKQEVDYSRLNVYEWSDLTPAGILTATNHVETLLKMV